jgi:hypothetical protein
MERTSASACKRECVNLTVNVNAQDFLFFPHKFFLPPFYKKNNTLIFFCIPPSSAAYFFRNAVVRSPRK